MDYIHSTFIVDIYGLYTFNNVLGDKYGLDPFYLNIRYICMD